MKYFGLAIPATIIFSLEIISGKFENKKINKSISNFTKLFR
jgi:hypothetical protein